MSREPCYKCKFEHKPIDAEPCEYCSNTYLVTGDHPNFERSKPLTHYDRLIRKSPEELAEWLAEVLFHCSNTICDKRCPMYSCCCDQPSDNILDWLREEATDDKA